MRADGFVEWKHALAVIAMSATPTTAISMFIIALRIIELKTYGGDV
ncbi:MAG TPA: hypothetical protein VEG61_03535 [Candidatus Dormibacteraeota bacterium]|nr:hypothetical protein [Candidatus Dormibacteraeota bacterium]